MTGTTTTAVVKVIVINIRQHYSSLLTPDKGNS